MEKEILLFDRYIDGSLSPEEKSEFEQRLNTDSRFAADFKAYLFVVDGVCREAEQDDIDFGAAMKNLSREDLLRIIGKEESGASRRPRFSRVLRRRMVWSGVAAAVVAGVIFGFFRMHQQNLNRIDELIVAYNDIPDISRGGDIRREQSLQYLASDREMADYQLNQLEKDYREAPADDMQAQEDAGMRLAMAYLKRHDRQKARELLNEMAIRFADDVIFSAQCREILSQIN